MARAAVTFPGKVGDILWSLPTAREIAKEYGPVDFYVMEHFAGICELIEHQPYINKCIGLEDWIVDGNKSLQDISPPALAQEYEKVHNLGYIEYPSQSLINISPLVAGVSLSEPVLPFINVEPKGQYDIVFGFSVYIQPIKEEFISKVISSVLQKFPNATWIDASDMPWKEFAEYTSGGKIYVGDKTGMHVIAHGLSKRYIIEAEGNMDRRSHIFSCPYDTQNTIRMDLPNHYGIIDYHQVYSEMIELCLGAIYA
jgi:hypothetical protein